MSNEDRIKWLLGATPDQLARFDTVINGDRDEQRASFRLYRTGEAATALGISRTTLWRAIREARLRTVEIREGSFRIPEEELIRFATGGAV
jgi:excisionase family DNA binding protein